MLEAGKLQLGDFNSTDAHRRAGGDGPWSPQAGSARPVLQVEGVGFIKQVRKAAPTGTHGPNCISWANLTPLSLQVAAEQFTCAAASSTSSPKVGAGRRVIQTPLVIFYMQNH
jgi:hypothetical protein